LRRTLVLHQVYSTFLFFPQHLDFVGVRLVILPGILLDIRPGQSFSTQFAGGGYKTLIYAAAN